MLCIRLNKPSRAFLVVLVGVRRSTREKRTLQNYIVKLPLLLFCIRRTPNNDLILHSFHESFLPLAGPAGVVPVPDSVFLQLFLRGQSFVFTSICVECCPNPHTNNEQRTSNSKTAGVITLSAMMSSFSFRLLKPVPNNKHQTAQFARTQAR